MKPKAEDTAGQAGGPPAWGLKNARPLGFVIAVLFLLLVARSWLDTQSSVRSVPYSAVEQALEEGRVAEVSVGDTEVIARLKLPESDGTQALAATIVEPAMAERLVRYRVPFERVRSPGWVLQPLKSVPS